MTDCSAIVIKDGKSLEFRNADNTHSIKIRNNNGVLESDPVLLSPKVISAVGFDYFYRATDTEILISKTNNNNQGSTTNIIERLEDKYPEYSTFIDLPKTESNYFVKLTGDDIGKIQYKGSNLMGNVIARICMSTLNNTNLYDIRILKNGIIIKDAISYQKIEDGFYSSGTLYLSINVELQNDDKLEVHSSHVVSNNTNNTTNTEVIAVQFSFLGYLIT